jgi:DNA-binding beta-propeller fold protein YncE
MRDDTIAIVDGRADTLAGFMDYTQSVIRGVVHNPVENKLYLVLPDRGEVWVLDRDYRLAATISVPMRRLSVFPLFNPGLNRLYLADSELLWVIDCASDSLLGGRTVTGFEQASTALLVQSLGKVYIFPRYVTGQYGAWVYDCLRDTVTAFILLPHRVVSAGYHQWSHCVYASVYNDSSVVVIDAAADTVVAKLRAGRRSSSNKVCANPLNGMVYHAINTGAEKLVSIDVRTNAVVDSVEIGDDADTIFWYPRHNKLYLCDRVTTSYVKVFDCNTGRVTATLPLPCGYAGALNEATERLYLGDAETLLVLDCRTDEVVGSVPLPSPARLSAVNMIDSRVYFADRSNWVAVIQDRLGVEEEERARGRFGFALASNPVRSRALFRYQLAPGEQAELLVYDACGRRVNRIAVIGSGRPQQLVWGRTDASGRAVAAGVYFAVLGAQGGTARVKVVVE